MAGVQRGRFWVTEDVDIDVAQEVQQDPTSARITSSNVAPMAKGTVLSAESQMEKLSSAAAGSSSGTGVQKKGRFLVVHDAPGDANKAAVEDAQSFMAQHQQDLPKKTAETMRRDSSSSLLNQISQDGSTNNLKKMGRFLVAENDDNSTKVASGVQQELEHAGSTIQTQSMSQHGEQSGTNTGNDSETYLKGAASGSDTESLPPVTNGIQKGRFFVAEEGETAETKGQGSMLSSGAGQTRQASQLQAQLAADPSRAPRAKKTVQGELRRLSNQNHTLHIMLKTLLQHHGLPTGNAAQSTQSAASASVSKPVTSSLVGSSTNLPKSATSNTSGLPRQHAASAADPLYLQGILQEVTHGTQNLIMEYNTIKQNNRSLKKQLTETKTQLKDALSTIENLKAQVTKLRGTDH